MAIGDHFAVFLGTATVNRQPAAGVLEEVSAALKDAVTDQFLLFDGTNSLEIFGSAIRTNRDIIDAEQHGQDAANMSIKISNAVFLRKGGTTDRVAVSGVQVDA